MDRTQRRRRTTTSLLLLQALSRAYLYIASSLRPVLTSHSSPLLSSLRSALSNCYVVISGDVQADREQPLKPHTDTGGQRKLHVLYAGPDRLRHRSELHDRAPRRARARARLVGLPSAFARQRR